MIGGARMDRVNGCKPHQPPSIFNHIGGVMKDWTRREFVDYFSHTAKMVHGNAVAHGWWDDERNDGELIALCHSELSEMLEALRGGNGWSEKIPDFLGVEEEAADVVIRLMDLSVKRGWRLGDAIIAKHAYNINRPFRHGKAF
jgi:NTP pyrophosphatase (non-canonical NTP hydrolase)